MILLDICPPGTRHSTVGRRTEVSPPMPAAQVAVADYRPDWWPADTRMLIRRVRLDVAAGQVSPDPRSRRRRTLHPDQRALPLAELADAVYGYSFILTNLDVSTPDNAADGDVVLDRAG